MAWSAADDADWLAVTPDSGSTTTATVDLVVSIDAAGLTEDESPYAAQITISATGAENDPQVIDVTLTIGGLADCLPLDDIDEDTTLMAGCYLADSNVDVGGDARLTIDPGVTIYFEQDTRLLVGSGAELVAAGTVNQPIVLTGTESTRGYWRGLKFSSSNSFNNQLDYVTIEYGGSEYEGNLVVGEGLGYPSRCSITNCTFRESGQYGLSIDGDAVIEEFAGNIMTANALGAARVHSNGAGYLDDTSSYSGNDVDVVVLSGSPVDQDQTWPAIDADYLVSSNLTVDADLTIAAGARLLFQQDTGMIVNGALSAIGTEAAPILFTAPGSHARLLGWAGVLRLELLRQST